MLRVSLGVAVPGPGSPRERQLGQARVSSGTCHIEPQEWPL